MPFLAEERRLCYNDGVRMVAPFLLYISLSLLSSWADSQTSYSLMIYGWPHRFRGEEVHHWPVKVLEEPQGLILVPLPGQEVRPGKDPFGGLTFRYSLALYTQNPLERSPEKELSREWLLRYRLYYRKAKHQALAQEIGRFILVSHHLIEEKLSLPLFYGESGVADIWLFDTGGAGAEQKGENLFFYQIEQSRSSLEWLREIAHEMGHLTLPGWSGFREPEGWANGDLGERLILRWLSREGGYTFGGKVVNFQPYLRRYYDPVFWRFVTEGWDDLRVRRRDQKAFEMTLGLALYIEYAHGPKGLGEVLKRVREPTPEGLLEAYARYLVQKKVWSLRLPGQGGWLYIPRRGLSQQQSSRDNSGGFRWVGGGAQDLFLEFPRRSQGEKGGNPSDESKPARILWRRESLQQLSPGWYRLIPREGREKVITLYQQ